MWKCRNCDELIDDQFDACWNCQTARNEVDSAGIALVNPVEGDAAQFGDEDKPAVEPEPTLAQILRLQNQQQKMLSDIQWKVGCLFVYMVVGILMGLLAFAVTLAR